mgnify:FL=1
MAAAEPLAWPFGTGGDYTEQLDWMTDVPAAATGETKHSRLRQSPRVTLAMASLEEGRARRRMDALLRQNSAGQWRAPVLVDACRLTAAADAADTVIALDVADARFLAGGHALLWNGDAFTAEVVEIDAGGVAADALTLAAGLASAWPAGTLVTPLRKARLTEFPQVGRFTSDASDVVDLAFGLIEPLDDTPEITGDTYRGYPVWPFRPVWTSDPAWVPQRDVQGVDYEFAPPVVHDLAGMSQGRTTMQYAPDTRAAVVAFRRALFALAGRWAPVWVDTATADVRIVANVANGANSIDIEGPLLADTGVTNNQRDLRIQLWNGTVLYRRVTGVTTPAPGVERLALGSAIATGFAAADVVLASWLLLSVQDADTNLLRYWTRDLLECELTWRQLVHGL